ncbi:MAG: 4-amino-4-deoxy-L-arabinose transferase [Marmoricola sp.]
MRAEAAAIRVLEHALSRRPTLGHGRLVCLDGPAGSGKTSLAAAIAERTSGQVVHMDELFRGWGGLVEAPSLVTRMLNPLAQGQNGHWHRYAWDLGAFAEWHQVRPGRLLVLEGVGSGCRPWAALTTTLVWVHAPRGSRMRRGLDRDGDEHAEAWRRWSVQEDALFAREHTRSRADVRIGNDDSSAAPGLNK